MNSRQTFRAKVWIKNDATTNKPSGFEVMTIYGSVDVPALFYLHTPEGQENELHAFCEGVEPGGAYWFHVHMVYDEGDTSVGLFPGWTVEQAIPSSQKFTN